MDEPLSALDAQSKHDIVPFLERLHAQLDIPVLYVSHATDEVARLADYMLLMRAGGIIASGPVAELLTRLDLPPACADGAEAIIEATVAGHDADFHLTFADFAGGRFTIAGKALRTGRPVRLRVLARDVSLTLARQSGTSVLNIFPVTVTALTAYGDAQLTVRLEAAGVPLLARITRKSAETLGVQPGKRLFAQVKSAALLA
jgi:molybdate transport system ATP-binding protein